jgi:hypothetical protein
MVSSAASQIEATAGEHLRTTLNGTDVPDYAAGQSIVCICPHRSGRGLKLLIFCSAVQGILIGVVAVWTYVLLHVKSIVPGLRLTDVRNSLFPWPIVYSIVMVRHLLVILQRAPIVADSQSGLLALLHITDPSLIGESRQPFRVCQGRLRGGSRSGSDSTRRRRTSRRCRRGLRLRRREGCLQEGLGRS